MWYQGEENAPNIVKTCLQSVKKYHPERRVIVLSHENLAEYITIPDFMKAKVDAGIISLTHLSDYIRLCLLSKYGGTWIDATVLLTGPIPDAIFTQEFFIFKSPTWLAFPKVPSEDVLSCVQAWANRPFHIGANWFMHAKPNSSIVNNIKNLHLAYWKNENRLVHYFIFHFLMTLAIMNDDECRKAYEQMLSIDTIKNHILQRALYMQMSSNTYNEIKELSTVHKLTYKETLKESSLQLVIDDINSR